jgi:hypothetical protein
MKIIVDMNLSPEWVGFFATHGIESVHWSKIGNPLNRGVRRTNLGALQGVPQQGVSHESCRRI